MNVPGTEGDASPQETLRQAQRHDGVLRQAQHDTEARSEEKASVDAPQCHAELVEASARPAGEASPQCHAELVEARGPLPELVEGIAGVLPREIVAPHTIDELAQIVRNLHAARKAFAFVGGATELELGNPPRALDTIVRTNALDRVIDYSPEDQTITVEAGMTFAELDRILAEHNQMLPLDVPDRERSTVGGAIATNAYGPRRQRYGTAKDLIVGVELVRPDGTRARGGGKVVKNVAGFDMPKLAVGSLGTLGAIVTATFRVYPIPEYRAAVRFFSDRRDAEYDVACALVASRLEPAAMIDGIVIFEGVEAGVKAQLQRAAAIAEVSWTNVDTLSCSELRVVEEREQRLRSTGDWRVRATCVPSRHFRYDFPPGSESVWYPLIGVYVVACDDRESPDFGDVGVPKNAKLVFHAVPARYRGTIDPWGSPPPSLPLMRALKERFDPLGLCNPGRFVGGL
jgi:glycolate oxidase FAD binding subunit